MRLFRRRLRAAAAPPQALLALDARAREADLPPPAALSGEWFGSLAVLAPALATTPTPRWEDALTTPARQPAVTFDPSDSAAGAVGGGWFGYLSYGLTDPGARNGPLPAAVWGWTSRVLRLDRTGQWWFEALLDERSDGGEAAADTLAAELDEVLTRPSPPGVGWTPSRACWPAADSYRTAVHSCVEAIGAGELFQANICTRITASFDGHPAELFAAGEIGRAHV